MHREIDLSTVCNVAREGLESESPAEQCRKMHIHPGHVLRIERDERAGCRPSISEATLLWLGLENAVWSVRHYWDRSGWSAPEETVELDLSEDWIRGEPQERAPAFAWSNHVIDFSAAEVGPIHVYVTRATPHQPWRMTCPPFAHDVQLDADTLVGARREAERLVRSYLMDALRIARGCDGVLPPARPAPADDAEFNAVLKWAR